MTNDPSGREARGFKGFDALVSDVSDMDVPKPRSVHVAEKAKPASAVPAARHRSSGTESGDVSPKSPTPERSSFGPGWKAATAIVIAIAVVGAWNSTPDKPQKPLQPTSQAYSAPQAAPQAAVAPPPPVAAAPSRPATRKVEQQGEEKPPIGSDKVLSVAQIRYCLAEDIRMSALSKVIDDYSQRQVDGFNALVADYNSRCASYRYRRGSLEAARRDVEARRVQLEREGVSRLRQWRAGR